MRRMRPVLSIHVPRLPFSLPQHNRRCNSPATTPCTHARVCLAHIDHYVCQLNQHKARRQRRRDVRALLLLRCSLSCRSGYSLHRFSGSPTSLTVPQAVCWQLVRRLLSCFGLSLSLLSLLPANNDNDHTATHSPPPLLLTPSLLCGLDRCWCENLKLTSHSWSKA